MKNIFMESRRKFLNWLKRCLETALFHKKRNFMRQRYIIEKKLQTVE